MKHCNRLHLGLYCSIMLWVHSLLVIQRPPQYPCEFQIKAMVYASLYPVNSSDLAALEDGIDKLSLNDQSVSAQVRCARGKSRSPSSCLMTPQPTGPTSWSQIGLLNSIAVFEAVRSYQLKKTFLVSSHTA